MIHPAQQRIIDTVNEQNQKYDRQVKWAEVGPELLKAAQAVDKLLPSNGATAHPAVQSLRAAIAKAKDTNDS